MVVEYVTADGDTDTVDFGSLWADGGDHAGIGNLAFGGDSGIGNVEYSVGFMRHTSAYSLCEADEIVDQAGAPDRLV